MSAFGALADVDGDFEEIVEKKKEAAAQKKQAEAAAEKAKEAKAAREPEKLDMKGLKVKAEDDVEEISIGGKSKAQKAKDKKAKELITDLNFTTPPIETASPSGGRGAVLYVY